jgi:hypothetical protein
VELGIEKSQRGRSKEKILKHFTELFASEIKR